MATAEYMREYRRNKHAHKGGGKITIQPGPKAAEPAHLQEIVFPSELKLGLLTTDELQRLLSDRQARLQFIERMPKLFHHVAAVEEQQVRADLLSFQNELMKRQLSKLQRESESLEEANV